VQQLPATLKAIAAGFDTSWHCHDMVKSSVQAIVASIAAYLQSSFPACA
jgi:hypothetical protein